MKYARYKGKTINPRERPPEGGLCLYKGVGKGRMLPFFNRIPRFFVNRMLIFWPERGVYPVFSKKTKKYENFSQKPLTLRQKIL